VHKVDSAPEIERQVEKLVQTNYSIHYHVWDDSAIIQLLNALRVDFGAGFKEELVAHNHHEVVMVLRKNVRGTRDGQAKSRERQPPEAAIIPAPLSNQDGPTGR
jgi:hypothetical protein